MKIELLLLLTAWGVFWNFEVASSALTNPSSNEDVEHMAGFADSDNILTTEQNQRDDRISIANMTCDFFEQPLNHFYIPKEKSPTYKQRYCYYNDFIKDHQNRTKVPIFFYTGRQMNEWIDNEWMNNEWMSGSMK